MTADPHIGISSRSVDRRRAMASEWTAAVDEIRQLAGFQDFLLPPGIATLRPAADEGPVVIVNVSRWRCDALLLTADGVRAMGLPALTAEAAAQQAGRLRRGEPAGALEWLWDTVAGPVLTELGLTDRPAADADWPRLWWCPTGPLSRLPLAAAGDGGERVIDRVVSSYTPSLQALVRARAATPATGEARMLAVVVPDRPAESDLLAEAFGDHHRILAGEQAVVAAVRAALPRFRWVHLACAVRPDADPTSGGLLLPDGAVGLAELGGGEFAFASAGPDEGVDDLTPAAALHLAGYQHVIGTLWPVPADTAVEVARAVYADLTTTGEFRPQRSAYALHAAARARRDAGHAPSAWASFVHTGP